MKLDHAQTILNRINRMFTDVAEGGGNASALERDLLKEYVRRLYESLSEHEGTTSHGANKAVEVEAPVKKAVPPVAEIRRPKKVNKPAPEPTMVEPAEQIISKKPRAIEIPASVEADIQEMESQAAFKAAPTKVDNTATVTHTRPLVEKVLEQPAFVASVASLPSAIKSIFEGEKSNDLSEKLAGAPVKDLNRAMAINERLLAQNDLFGGSKDELDSALSHLNTLSSYEDATSYLGAGAAVKYDWSEGERVATARAFAKLVRRRYA